MDGIAAVGNGANAPRDLCLSRDELALIYEEHAKAVYNFLYFRLGGKEAAEDLTGDIFVKVITNYSRYKPDKGEFKVWLFAIAHNALRDYFRMSKKHGSHVEIRDDDAAPPENEPEEAAVRRAETQRLSEAMRILKEKERNVVSLKYGAGLRNKDIAALTALSEKNVGVILCRSLAKLKKEIGDEFYE